MGTVSTRPLPARPAPECSTESKSDAIDHYDNIGGAISANLNLCAISGQCFLSSAGEHLARPASIAGSVGIEPSEQHRKNSSM